MLLGTRKALRRTARGLLAVMAGAWLLAAAAPCVMAQPVPTTDPAGCCTDKAAPLSLEHCETLSAPLSLEHCETLSALDCRPPEPAPPSAALDLPAPAPVLAYTLPALALSALPDSLGPPTRADTVPLPLPLNRKHSRLLI